MHLLKHDILTEFPQYHDKIRALKSSHGHFAKICETYETLNHAIAQAEMHGTSMTDEAMELEKKKRLKLKDEIALMLSRP